MKLGCKLLENCTLLKKYTVATTETQYIKTNLGGLATSFCTLNARPYMQTQ